MSWFFKSLASSHIFQTQRVLFSVTTSMRFTYGRPARKQRFHPTTTTSQQDWNTHDEFFEFTRGRFVRDESDQLAMRRVRFNMNELARIAAEAVGARSCIGVAKCLDGMYNKTFLMSMDDGQEVIAKVPNPNAGISHFTTASEVAAMDFARKVLKTPVPKVYRYSTQAGNSVGAEYVIMEKIVGVQLSEVWTRMKLVDKMNVRLHLARIQSSWISVKFAAYGGLYYARDLQNISIEGPLYKDEDGVMISDSAFTIGPVTGRDWVDEGRQSLSCDRGPWKSVYDYYKAIGQREKLAISTTPQPKQTVMICGPGFYQPSTEEKLSSVDSYLRIFDAILPLDDSITAPRLWHNDLHAENIFVDGDDHSKIVGIIDWQGTDLLPLIDRKIDPAFIEYDGPEPETLERPLLEDTGLEGAEKAEAIKRYYEKALFVASRKIALKKTPDAYKAIEFQQTDAFNLLILARRLFEFGEAHFHALALELRDTWSDLPAIREFTPNRPFPISVSDERTKEILTLSESAIRGIQVMNEFKTRLGPLWPDKDAVGHEQYDDAKTALRQLKHELLMNYGKLDAERVELERLWPFDD